MTFHPPARFQGALERVRALEADPRYLGAFIFGSVADGTATEKSDLDLKVIVDSDNDCGNINHPHIGGLRLDATFRSMRQIEEFTEDEISEARRPPNLARAIIVFDKTGELTRLQEKAKKIDPPRYEQKNEQFDQFMLYHADNKVARVLADDPVSSLYSMHANIHDVVKIHYRVHDRWPGVSSKRLLDDLETWDPELAALLKKFVVTAAAEVKFALWTQILDHVAAPLGGRQPIDENNCDCGDLPERPWRSCWLNFAGLTPRRRVSYRGSMADENLRPQIEEVVIGTTNQAKARQCRAALAGFGLRTVPITDLLEELPAVAENHPSTEENAAAKARAFMAMTGKPVLALDYGLSFEGLPPESQPGRNLRRIPGDAGRPSDEQLIAYYSDLFARQGGRVRGSWDVGAAFVTAAGESRAVTFAIRRTFVSSPSGRLIAGYPLASLQLADAERGIYISDLTKEEEERLWQDTLGEHLFKLVTGTPRDDAPPRC